MNFLSKFLSDTLAMTQFIFITEKKVFFDRGDDSPPLKK